MFIYKLRQPIKYNKKESLFDHDIFIFEDKTIITPKKFEYKNINPSNFHELRNILKIKKIIIEDNLKDGNKNRCIVGHVNKAGFNFLYKKTPFLNFPTFPDMSNIYTPIEGFKAITVHTLGPKRFKEKTDKKYFYSEITGLVSPVWHYLNVEVFGRTI
jgi:hypothetical protein